SESELSVGDFPDVATAALAQLRSVNGLAAAATAVATSDGDVATATPPTPAPTPTTSTVALSDQQRHCRELSESERQQILLSDNFQAFFARASRVVERALAETEAEYFETDGEADAGSDAYDEGAVAGGSSVRVVRGRCVTALDWSPHYQELCLAAYAESQQSHPGGDSDGVVCVWNARYRCDSPEFALHCQSPVTSACFATYQRCLIVGAPTPGSWCSGTPGLIASLNLRTYEPPLCPTHACPAQHPWRQGHTEPCVFTRVLGTERANFLATLSSDARLCTWSLESLTQPVETCDLMLSAAGHSIRSLAATCLDMLDGNRFVAGTEDAMLCVGCRHGVRAGVMTSLAASHQAPVTSVAANPSPDLSHVVLSSSMDWTARVWSLREPAEQPLALEAAADYVMDARWSPAHPGLLCTADAAGRLDLWSLGSDPEQPLARCQPMGASGAGLNRCCFNRTGCVLTAGDHLGRVALLELSEALASPRPDEAQLVLRALHEARQARA
uniref:WD_REPEATS_REGION domain-containing protein n=1 Tax=Macrostomum lignano TaxID=282301 RepID=A0A1I8JLD5_9PLAT